MIPTRPPLFLLAFAILFSCHSTKVLFGTGDTAVEEDSVEDDTNDTSDSNDTDDSGDSDTEDTVIHEVEGFTLTLDDDVVTMIHASWTDPGASEAWVEYQFEGGDWLQAPLTDPGQAVILGIPAETLVQARPVLLVEGETWTAEPAEITTGILPKGPLAPTVSVWNPDLAYEAEYAMIVVSEGDYTFSPPYWIEIIDRQGRILWYQEIPDDMMSFSASVARDNTHIWFEAGDLFGMGDVLPSVTRQTLDRRATSNLSIPQLGQAISEGPDGSFFFETRDRGDHALSRVDPDGEIHTEWDCSDYFRDLGISSDYCDMNACNWDESRNTVLVSQFYTDTVFEIDLDTGAPIRQMGQLTRGDPWSFDPSDSIFDYQHFPYWTEAGTLLVSTHVRGRYGTQVAAEYELDDKTQTLHRVWSYTSSDIFATQVGEATRLPNGNTTQGYGQDGAVREVTSDGTVVWEAEWPRDDYGYRVIGHLSLIPDLYALNAGPVE